MAEPAHASDTALLRLSRYHCLLGEMLGSRQSRPVTSHEIAQELGVSEETVRHDFKNVSIEGRPGAGYDMAALHQALQEYLDLQASHPFIAVGGADILRGLAAIFPAEKFGMRPVGYFSERAEDVGEAVHSIKIEPFGDLAERVRTTCASLALVACESSSVDDVLAELADAGITGVLMLTPVIRPKHPDNMKVTYFRIPCALKSLAAATESPPCPAHC